MTARKSVAERVAARFRKEAMAKLLRNLAGHDWGFWSDEEPRFHIQTVEKDAEDGPKAVKFWLEDRGTRTFELVYGKTRVAEVRKRVRAEWHDLEARWIALMVAKGWVRAYLKDGDKIIVEAYPGDAGASFTRVLDLREILAGHFSPHVRGGRPIKPKDITINRELDAVEIWPDLHESKRHHFPLSKILFVGKP